MTDSPYSVTARNGRVNFFVGSFIPRTMAVAAQNATLKSIIRLAGGMNNDPTVIYPFFRVALSDMNGAVLMSGGTRAFGEDYHTLASVCEVVVDLTNILPDVITMGSFPRTGRFGLIGDGHFMVGDGDKATINVGTDYVVAVQQGPEDSQSLGWDGDVQAYIDFMTGLRDEMNFKTAVIVWGGGGVTIKEAQLAAAAGIWVFVVTGTGRAADNQLSEANFHGPFISHVSKDDPELLWAMLNAQGLSS